MKQQWSILAVFVVVGLLPALGYIGNGVLFTDALAQGAGRTLAVAVLACLGLLYRPNKNLGFAIAAAIFSVLVLFVTSKQGMFSNANAGQNPTEGNSAEPEQPPEPLGVWHLKRVTDKMTDDVITFATAKLDGSHDNIVDTHVECRTSTLENPKLLYRFMIYGKTVPSPARITSGPRIRFNDGDVIEKKDALSDDNSSDFALSRAEIESLPRLRVEFDTMDGKVVADINGRDPNVRAVYSACLSASGDFADLKGDALTKAINDSYDATREPVE